MVCNRGVLSGKWASETQADLPWSREWFLLKVTQVTVTEFKIYFFKKSSIRFTCWQTALCLLVIMQFCAGKYILPLNTPVVEKVCAIPCRVIYFFSIKCFTFANQFICTFYPECIPNPVCQRIPIKLKIGTY